MNKKLPVKPLPYPTRKRSIFKTLLWAEGTPRYPVLRFIFLFLILYATPSLAVLLEAIIPDFEANLPDFSNPFDNAKYLALAGVLCGLFGHGCRGLTARPVWQSMALPVTTRRLALTAIYYQARLALLLGTLWGLSRVSAGVDDPIGHALRMTLILSAQGQAALLWLSAAGAIQGLTAFTMGLIATGCAGFIASHVGPFSPATNMATVLVVGGWTYSYAATQAMRGGPIPQIDLSQLPGVARLRDWHLARTMRKTQFTSPFWAQVWFEWQRSARWFPAVVAATLVLTLCIDVPHIFSTGRAYFDLEKDGGDTILNPYGAVTLLIPLLFWFLHAAVTRPYRNFVFTQPNTVQRVGRAKLFAALFAAAVIAVISGLKVWIYTELLPTEAVDSASASGFFLWNALLAQATAASVAFLCLVYGPSLFVPGMLQIFQFILSRFLSGGLLPEHVDQSVRVFDLLVLVIPLLVSAILFSSIVGTFALRQWKRADYPFPWELIAVFVVTVGLFGAAEFEQFADSGLFWGQIFAYAGPALSMLAVIRYGHRVGLLDRRLQQAVLGLFAVLFLIYALSSLTFPGTQTAGYWIALAIGSVVFYPMAIGSQREEQERRTTAELPYWGLLFLFPIIWVAFHFLGEDLSERESRT